MRPRRGNSTTKIEECLRRAREHGIRSVAFPANSCGVYGYPIEKAAAIAVDTVVAECNEPPGIERVLFVLHSGRDCETYLAALAAAGVLDKPASCAEYRCRPDRRCRFNSDDAPAGSRRTR